MVVLNMQLCSEWASLDDGGAAGQGLAGQDGRPTGWNGNSEKSYYEADLWVAE